MAAAAREDGPRHGWKAQRAQARVVCSKVCSPDTRPEPGSSARTQARNTTMRILIAVASALLTGPSLADSVRHLSVPERFLGTWAPSADLCRDKKSIIAVSSKGYE